MARQFNGTNQTLSADAAVNMSAYQKGAYAMWLWVDSYGGSNQAALAHFNNTSTPRVRIFPDNALGTFYVEYVDSAISTGEITRPTAGQWNHIVVNIDITKASSEIDTIYVNGSSVSVTRNSDGNNSGNLPPAPTVNDFCLASDNASSAFMAGRMAEVALWGGILLSGTDVTNLYNSGNGTSATNVQNGNLVYYWQICGTASPEPPTTGTPNLTLVNSPTQVAHPISGAGICGGVGSASFGGAPINTLFRLRGYRGY